MSAIGVLGRSRIHERTESYALSRQLLAEYEAGRGEVTYREIAENHGLPEGLVWRRCQWAREHRDAP